ncbi:MAG TPA: phosphotransferase [Thermomicrobiales bacterium]|nr:phosphotransferase [Thermomicrobiales bacterium]
MSTLGEHKRIAAGREAEVYDWEDGLALRLLRQPSTDHRLQREMAVMTTVREMIALAPAADRLIEVDGRPGMILERVEGPTLLATLARLPRPFWGGRLTGRIHARINQLTPPELLPPLKLWIRPRIETAPVRTPIVDRALAIMEALPRGNYLLHGDLHPDNILMPATGPVVIDWPNASSGPPEADVARTITILRFGTLPNHSPVAVRLFSSLGRRPLIHAYLREYERIQPLDHAVLNRWLFVRAVDRLSEAIPDEQARILIYLERAMNDEEREAMSEEREFS